MVKRGRLGIPHGMRMDAEASDGITHLSRATATLLPFAKLFPMTVVELLYGVRCNRFTGSRVSAMGGGEGA